MTKYTTDRDITLNTDEYVTIRTKNGHEIFILLNPHPDRTDEGNILTISNEAMKGEPIIMIAGRDGSWVEYKDSKSSETEEQNDN